MALEQTSYVLAARADRYELIPTIRTFGLVLSTDDVLDLHATSVVEHAATQREQLRLWQLTAHAHQKFHRPAANAALQTFGERAVGSDEFEPTVDLRHWRHGEKALTGATRQALEQSLAQRFARRTMTKKRRLLGFQSRGIP